MEEELPPIARSRRRRRRRRRLQWVAIVAGVSALALVAAAPLFGRAAKSAIRAGCDLGSVESRDLGQNSFVFAADGTRLGSIPTPQNRRKRSFRQLSPWLVKATVAIEDRRFWEHDGVDLTGIARAAVANALSRDVVQGGSTITQQLARNVYLEGNEASVGRKLEEACLALQLESASSKERILTEYLNTVFYGSGAYGAQAAAQTYFSRDVAGLTLAQAALLAGLPQAPSLYDPRVNPEAARARRNAVLGAMHEAGDIDRERYERAGEAPLGLRPGRRYVELRQPRFVDYVRGELDQELGEEVVRAGGLRIRTTLDLRLQRAALQAMRRVLPSRRDPAAAVVAIDPQTGAIRALADRVPGRQGFHFNLATQGRRQAGSAFKPIALVAAIEHGMRPSVRAHGPPTLQIDDERCRTNGRPWRVANYGREDAGILTLRGATVRSTNTIFAQVVVIIGPDTIARMANRLGIRTELAPVCSLALGTEAVSPLELTAAYATFAAGGVHRRPQAVDAVLAPDGGVLKALDPEGEAVLHPHHAAAVTAALRDVIEKGTGRAAAIGRPAAGKTGTTDDYRDAWFCGYVPQLAACVWMGYPGRAAPLRNVQGLAYVAGGSLPARIWREFMTAALSGTPVAGFGG